MADEGQADPVAAYKAVLRAVLERRPSGMRQRLAEALGTTRGFVTQITHPSYATPIPAPYIPVILEVCHFSDAEKERFLGAWRAAHPRRGEGAARPVVRQRTIEVTVPDLGSEEANADFDQAVQDVVARMRQLVDKAR